jgi:catechol 2,3-dioxygenase-like lactoylglutathione lyase family enzyme
MAKKKQSSSPAGKRGKGKKPTAGRNTSGRLTLAALRNRRRRDPESLRLRALEPSLTVDDIEQSVHFYTSVLGFIVAERWTEGGKLLGVNLKAGACEIGLSQDDWAKGRDRTKGVGVRIWCRTAQDIDSLAARIKAAGGRLASEPADQSWGVRSLAVDDPDGYHLAIYQERGDAS